MALFSKKQKQLTNKIISTLVISPDNNNDLDEFTSKLSNIKLENINISQQVDQHKIQISNIKQCKKSVSKLKLSNYDVAIFFHCDTIIDSLLPIIRSNNKLFIIIFSKNANESAIFREKLFNMFCNMITKDIHSIYKIYKIIFNTKQNYINNTNNKNIIFYNCPHPSCGIQGLTEDDLWHHFPLYHIGTRNLVSVRCPICNVTCGSTKTPFQVHLRNKHGLCATHKCEPEYKHGVSSYVFALVVVRRKSDNKFLLVQEFASCGFWLPGGRVDPGETTESAALRECEEEAGVKIKLKGILKIEYRAFRCENRKYEHIPDQDYNRMRVIYYGEPDLGNDENDNNEEKKDDKNEENSNDDKLLLAKSIPDYESMGACWVNSDEVMKIKLRAYEPSHWIPYVVDGGKIYPMELLACEQRNTVM
eukprot:526327_1